MLTECREYRPRLIEMARGGVSATERAALEAHVEVCAACARALDEQVALSAAFDRIAGGTLAGMPAMEARVLAEFDRAAAKRRLARWIPVVGLAAAALLGLVSVERQAPVERARQTARPATEVTHAFLPPVDPHAGSSARLVQVVKHKEARAQTKEDSQEFIPIPYTVPLGPEERASIVRMEVPVAALIAVGFPVPPVDPGATVVVDVLVGQDGRARAIRLVK